MSIRIGWDEMETPTVLLNFDREWTWLDYRSALEAAAEMQQEAGVPVGLLHHVPTQVRLPDMFLSNIAPFILCEYPVDVHTAAVVTPDLLSEMMLRAIFRIYGKEQPQYLIEAAHTLNEARRIILRRAEELGIG